MFLSLTSHRLKTCGFYAPFYKPLLKPTVKYFVCYVWLQVTYLQPFFLTIRENAVVPNAPCLNPIFPAFSEILCAVIPNSAHPLFAENP